MGCSVRATWAREVEAFLAMLATQHKALASTHNPALSAFGFLRRLGACNEKILPGFRMFFGTCTRVAMAGDFCKPKMPLALKQRA